MTETLSKSRNIQRGSFVRLFSCFWSPVNKTGLWALTDRTNHESETEQSKIRTEAFENVDSWQLIRSEIVGEAT